MSEPLHLFKWKFSISLTAPISLAGVQNAAFGLDINLLKTQSDEFCISGDQIRGNFRHFLKSVQGKETNDIKSNRIAEQERLVPDAMFKAWFGGEGVQSISLKPEQGRNGARQLSPPRAKLTIRDAVWDGGKVSGHHKTRIAVDPTSGSVKPGAYLVSEQLDKTGASHRFEGDILLYGLPAERDRLEKSFKLFMEALVAIGGMKSAGYGWLDDPGFSIEFDSDTPLQIPEGRRPLSQGLLTLTFDTPLLVDPELGSGNVQTSSPVIPGANIKAAIGEFGRLADPEFDLKYNEILSRLTIGAAIPCREDQDPLPVFPFCVGALTGSDEDEFYNIFDLQDHHQGVVLETDFKEKHWRRLSGSYLFASRQVDYVSRTRTAIQEGSSRALDEKLFNYRMLNTHEKCWKLRIGIENPSAEDSAKVASLVSFLTEGAVQIGKTRSNVLGSVESAPHQRVEPRVRNGAVTWTLVLQTPAFLLDGEALDRLDAGDDMTSVYRACIGTMMKRELGKQAADIDVEEAFDLDAFRVMARHAFEGGDRALRYRTKAGADYYPFVMTVAGSVFHLPQRPGLSEGAKFAVEAAMVRLANFGLPSVDGDETTNPFVPQNGYGAVRIVSKDLDPNL